jgi:NAD-dependent deacetylase
MKVLFLTGAGISANAGIATYRDGGSSWVDSDLEAKSHSTRYGNHLDELWDRHWGPVSKAMSEAEPTHTHRAIAEFQKKHDVIIATQNIELLHERAGSENVAHLHGDMRVICIRCRTRPETWTFDGPGAPTCGSCGSRKTRPDVVLFGEQLNKRMFSGLENFAREADYVIAVGTSLNVFPAAGLVMDNTAKSIIVNMERTPFNKFALKSFEADCDRVIDEVLDGVDNRLW